MNDEVTVATNSIFSNNFNSSTYRVLGGPLGGLVPGFGRGGPQDCNSPYMPSFQAMKSLVWDALAAEKCNSIVRLSVLNNFVIITDCIQRVLGMFVLADV